MSWSHPHRNEESTKLWPTLLVVAEQSTGIRARASTIANLRIVELHTEVGALGHPEREEVLNGNSHRRARQLAARQDGLWNVVGRRQLTQLGESALDDAGLPS